ncbi:MAG TPA: hypothetical protein PK765_01235 [bacterium]|nr:hypothetical protein [bacterium]
MDVGGDATEGTEDDVVYEGTFYASENEDGVIEAVLTDEDGAVSDYASFEYVSDNEIEGTVSFNGVETFVKAARECKRQPRKDDRHGAMNGSGMTVDSNGNSIRMNGEGMEVRQEMRQIRKSMLSEALKAKLDVRLEKMDEEVRHAFYPRVIERIDEIVAKLPDGKKKQLYIDLRDYFEQKWYEEFPEDVESAEEDILDEVFSSEE